MKEKKEIREDFRLILGNEIYLVDSLEEVRDNYEGGVTKFPHFILIAKNRKGFEALSKLSTQAWKNSFFTGTMERVPTEKKFLREVMEDPEYQGNLIATSACLGAPQNVHLIKMKENPQQAKTHYQRAVKEVQWAVDTFGKEDYFIELQPADTELQRFVNEKLVQIADELGLESIVACDTHYARPEDRDIHRDFLNSKEGDREVDEFYYYAFMHSVEEMYDQMAYYLGKDVVDRAVENTKKLYDKTEDYTLDHSPIIPKIKIPEFEVKHMFKPAYDKYPHLKELAESDVKDNQYLLHLIEDGYMKELHYKGISKEEFHKILNRLDLELREILGISKKLNDSMSGYYLSCREIVNIIWDDSDCGGNSLVGSGRGSGAGFLINYLLGITQINPLEYVNMPHERHLSKERPELPKLNWASDVNVLTVCA